MKFTTRELIFMEETINALLKTGARIGKDHYSITISRLELIRLVKKINRAEAER